ncbi:MAG: hypothetical protein QW117_00930 [Candidatus Pacearchaeota archaeon]
MARQKKLEVEDKIEEKKEIKGKKEIEKIIIELAKSGLTAEKIGLVLKQKYNINNVKKETGKKISQILKENNLYIDPDIKNLKEKKERLEKHIAKHKHDYTAKRILPIVASKVKKLEKIKEK